MRLFIYLHRPTKIYYLDFWKDDFNWFFLGSNGNLCLGIEALTVGYMKHTKEVIL